MVNAKRLVTGLLVLAALGAGFWAVRPRTTVDIALLRPTIEPEESTTEPGLALLLYSEEGNLIRRRQIKVTDQVRLTLPSRQRAGQPSKSYVLRVLAADGSVGVVHLSDRLGAESETNHLTLLSPPAPAGADAPPPGRLSGRSLVNEATYPAIRTFTTVGEVHTGSYMLANVTMTSDVPGGEVGIEGRLRWVGQNDWIGSTGFKYEPITHGGGSMTLLQFTNPDGTVNSGAYVQTEYSYRISVWAQRNRDGEVINRWEELSMENLVGGGGSIDATGDNMAPFDQVVTDRHRVRNLIQGGSRGTWTCTERVVFPDAASVAGANLRSVTAYQSGFKVSYYIDPHYPELDTEAKTHVVYSRGGINEDGSAAPATYWTHD